MEYDDAGVQFQRIEGQLGLKFKNHILLGQVFIHHSYVNEHEGDIESNERLEFLGDAMIGLATADYYYKNCPEADEGILTDKRKAKVNRKDLADAARRLKLGDYLIFSRGEKLSKGSEKNRVLAGCFEALLGAIFLEFGYPRASQFVIESLIKK